MDIDRFQKKTVLDQLMERKSIRIFTNTPIQRKEKQAILEAACAAPTAGNQQLYTILDITDQKIKNALAETCDHQHFIATAPMVLIFLADVRRWLDLYQAANITSRKPGPGDLFLAVSDANIAAENAVTAAWSLGIGSCFIGDVMENYEKQRILLSLPTYVFPAAMVVFGYPTKQQAERQKPARAPLSSIVKENAYYLRSPEELMAMTKKDWHFSSFEDWAVRFCSRKYHSDFSLEMNRSVAAYLSEYDEKNNEGTTSHI